MLAPPIYKRVKATVPAPDAASPIPMRGSMPEWVAILRECGFPSHVTLIDFETYRDSAYSLCNMSAVEYIADSRFEELGVSVLHMDSERPFAPVLPHFWTDIPNTLRNLQDEFGPNLERTTVVAHNAPFDVLLMAQRYGIRPPFVIDTIGLDRAVEARRSHKLEDIAPRLGLPSKGDSDKFIGWSHRPRFKFKAGVRAAGKPPIVIPGMTPDQVAEVGDYANNDAIIEWGVFERLLPMLSNRAFELRVMNHTLQMTINPCIAVDEKYAAELIAAMNAELEKAIARTGLTPDELSGDKSFFKSMSAALAKHGQKVPMKLGKVTKANPSGMIPAFAKDDPERKELVEHKCPVVRDLICGRIAQDMWPKNISRVARIVKQSKSWHGKLPAPLKYQGAHTGRWSGDGKINLQNLPSRPDPNRPEVDLCIKTRGVLVAPPGYKLVIADASVVEPRATAYLAGQEDMCELFRQNAEVYCIYAGRMVGRKLRKKTKDDPKPLAKYLDRMRNMGKVQVIGCNYGMGADNCVDFAKNNYGVILSLDDARRLVNSYRESVPQIVRFWNDVERAFIYVTKYGERVDLARGLAFYKEGDYTIIELPSTRKLYYEGARVRRNINGYEAISMPNPKRPGTSIHMWGGYLTENIVQAFCRDLLAYSILGMEDRGHRVGLTVHDEIVCVSPEKDADKCMECLMHLLCTPPDWAAGCPLNAEGHISGRYTK